MVLAGHAVSTNGGTKVEVCAPTRVGWVIDAKVVVGTAKDGLSHDAPSVGTTTRTSAGEADANPETAVTIGAVAHGLQVHHRTNRWVSIAP